MLRLEDIGITCVGGEGVVDVVNHTGIGRHLVADLHRVGRTAGGIARLLVVGQARADDQFERIRQTEACCSKKGVLLRRALAIVGERTPCRLRISAVPGVEIGRGAKSTGSAVRGEVLSRVSVTDGEFVGAAQQGERTIGLQSNIFLLGMHEIGTGPGRHAEPGCAVGRVIDVKQIRIGRPVAEVVGGLHFPAAVELMLQCGEVIFVDRVPADPVGRRRL